MPSFRWSTSSLNCSSRRAIPNPCSGPIACSVFRIIRSSVPCSTSDFLWTPAFLWTLQIRYQVSFGMSIGKRLPLLRL